MEVFCFAPRCSSKIQRISIDVDYGMTESDLIRRTFQEGIMVIDLVCKMEIDEKSADNSLVFESEMYFFCSEGCRAEFIRHPEDYVNPPASCGKESSEETLNV